APPLVLWLGALPYTEASRVHQHWLRVARDTFEPWDILLLCEHPAVYTVGIWRGLYLVQEERQLGLRANVHCMDRSGVITFHGPRWYTDGQLVCYPVLHLCRSQRSLGLQAGRDRVWIWDRKICAIGESLGPRNGVTQAGATGRLLQQHFVRPLRVALFLQAALSKVVSRLHGNHQPRSCEIPEFMRFCELWDLTSSQLVVPREQPGYNLYRRPLEGTGPPGGAWQNAARALCQSPQCLYRRSVVFVCVCVYTHTTHICGYI
uniref:Uncharacterized protein n=1 Tax=Leptobrachium leishanense TaxID=445787 RepID=A0A8C5LSP3_9ANUR